MLLARYVIAGAAQLLGCSTNRIRMAEEGGRFPSAPSTEFGALRLLYGGGAAQHARGVECLPARDESDKPPIVAVQNFKAGSANQPSRCISRII